jgi:hypothetical protein
MVCVRTLVRKDELIDDLASRVPAVKGESG